MPSLNDLLKALGIEEVRNISKEKVADAIAKKVGEIVEKETKPFVQAALKHEAVDKIFDSLGSLNNPALDKLIIELRTKKGTEKPPSA